MEKKYSYLFLSLCLGVKTETHYYDIFVACDLYAKNY